MTALPLEILLGIYLGLLTGIVPAFVAGALGFVVRYFTGVTLPGFGVVVLALSIASVQGGLLGLIEPDIAQSPRLLVAVLVVLMLALYAHSQGDTLGATMPRRLSLTALRQRTLSADVVEFVGTVGQVTVRPTGEIQDLEGYPSLSLSLRSSLRSGSWRLPADLPLSELAVRLEDRLRTEHDLADVSVSIDEKGRATIAAAPPLSGLSNRIPDGFRAVSLTTLVPTGLAPSDEVTLEAGDTSIRGTVCSVRSEADDATPVTGSTETPATDGGVDEPTDLPDHTSSLATAGGVGRITVAVPQRKTKPLLAAPRVQCLVHPRATSDAFEAFSLVKRAGQEIRHVTIRSTDGEPLPDPTTHDLTTIAVKRRADDTADRQPEWTFAPSLEQPLEPGDECYLAGRPAALERYLGEER
ncbi:potassium transporter TrkA [Natronosalvus vescus]|uniref:potassium transporter TrkA n=1 Tax=Natronosalvus vescus TaxID=2953881 RepID=UPI00209110AE|nr:potassium transporter TrkA [Natronosalvus vescus]